ncbi:hypothetical protein [Muricoccus vinaceus]|uniref:Uncharacterized protein n=1 Tax=Muricoccus vinaceus TaxID=424704 RepID=A0ABV6IZH6_9PROT
MASGVTVGLLCERACFAVICGQPHLVLPKMVEAARTSSSGDGPVMCEVPQRPTEEDSRAVHASATQRRMAEPAPPPGCMEDEALSLAAADRGRSSPAGAAAWLALQPLPLSTARGSPDMPLHIAEGMLATLWRRLAILLFPVERTLPYRRVPRSEPARNSSWFIFVVVLPVWTGLAPLRLWLLLTTLWDDRSSSVPDKLWQRLATTTCIAQISLPGAGARSGAGGSTTEPTPEALQQSLLHCVSLPNANSSRAVPYITLLAQRYGRAIKTARSTYGLIFGDAVDVWNHRHDTDRVRRRSGCLRRGVLHRDAPVGP